MCDCDNHNHNDSGFIIGLFIGAIISSLVAIYIYKNDRTDIFDKLKKTLTGYFNGFTKTPPPPPRRQKRAKILVTLPENISSVSVPKTVTQPKPRTFKK